VKKANEIKKTVADNLKKYRREKGMTQKELADEINKSPKRVFFRVFSS
jgi:DNA-binding XRE family transcriptional regulator